MVMRAGVRDVRCSTARVGDVNASATRIGLVTSKVYIYCQVYIC